MILNPSPTVDASATVRGSVSLANQTMGAGDKTFPGAIVGTKATGLSLQMNTNLLVTDPVNMVVGVGTATPSSTLDVLAYNPPYAIEGIYSYLHLDGAWDPAGSHLSAITADLNYQSSAASTGLLRGLRSDVNTSASHTGPVMGMGVSVDTAAASRLAGLHVAINGSVATRGYSIYVVNAFPAGTSENFNIFCEGRAPDTDPDGFYVSNPGTKPFVLTDKNWMGIGTVTPTGPLQIIPTSGSLVLTDSGQLALVSLAQAGMSISEDYSSVGSNTGLFVNTQRSGGSSPSAVVGVDSFVNRGGGTGTAALIVGFQSLVQNLTASATKMAGFYAKVNNATGVTTNAGFWAVNQAGGGSLNAGFYAENFTGTGYPLYYAGTTSKVAITGTGRFGVGTDTPDSYLHLVGTTGAGTAAHINPGSYAFTGTKYGLLIDPISGGTVFNMAIDYTGVSSQFKVYGNARTKVVNSGGLSSDFGGGTMVTAFEANTTTTGVAPTTHAFGTYTATSFTGALGLAGGVYGYNSDMTIAHTAGAVATVAGSNIGIVITADGTIGNLFGHIIGFSRPSGTGAITNQFGLHINPVELATGQKYSIWANGPTGSPNSWQVDYRSRMTGWVQDTPHPAIATATEGFYYGAAHDTNATITETWGGYVDSELFGTLGLTNATGFIGSIYLAKTGGTVTNAVSLMADFYSDTSTAITNLIGFQTTYEFVGGTPVVTNQYGIRLAPVDKGASRWGIYIASIPRIAGQSRAIRYGDTGQFNFIVEDDASTWVWTEGTDSGSKAAGLGTNINLAFYGGCGPNSVPLPGPSTVDKVMGFWADPWWWDQDVAVGVESTGYYSTPHNSGTTLTNLVGYSAVPGLDSGTTTNMIGFWSRVPVVGTGVVTNAYGIRIDSLTLGTATNVALGYDVGGTRQFLIGGDGVVTYRANTSITAFAGGGQASATALTAEVNFVTTVATAADSVKLPTAVLGKSIVVFNRHATNSCDVFPASGGAIDALGTNVAYALAAGASRVFYGQSATQWHSR